ncbi:terminase [Streptomyces solincola]|uniref:terminase n=1 Tax=Streptomyces solincola TaxID=2100817 RepID=UPI001C611BA3|nr:terminase [Streptomyces solincola]
MNLDPWQVWTMEQACAVKEQTFYNEFTDEWQRMWAAFEVGLVVSRQNGKGSILEARELAGLYLFGERLIIHSAHQFDTSKEAFARILMLIEQTPDLEAEVKRVSRSHGEEGIELKSGQRLRFRTRTKGGGRGFTGDCLILDEAMYLDSSQVGALMPTLSARPNPQLWYTGSAGDKESTQLGRVRSRALKHNDHRLFYAEWSIDACTDFCLSTCTDHDDPTAVSSFARANPGLGIRISVEHVQSEQRSMDPDTFAQERLGVGDWPVDGDQWAVIGEDSWKARTDEASFILDGKDDLLLLAVDTSPNRAFSSIGACGKNPDDLLHVEITGYEQYDHRPGTQWVVPRLKELWASLRPAAVVIDKVGQAGAFIGELEEAGIKVLSPTTYEYAQACGEFYSGIVPRKGETPRIVHIGQTPLTNAVAGADKRDLADKWAWDKKNSSSDISPLVSVTLAAWGYRKLLHERPAAAAPWVVRR